jgi:hypothetical protein
MVCSVRVTLSRLQRSSPPIRCLHEGPLPSHTGLMAIFVLANPANRQRAKIAGVQVGGHSHRVQESGPGVSPFESSHSSPPNTGQPSRESGPGVHHSSPPNTGQPSRESGPGASPFDKYPWVWRTSILGNGAGGIRTRGGGRVKGDSESGSCT